MTPREILKDAFSSTNDLPISGGWGQSRDSACVIEKDDPAAVPGLGFDPWDVIRAFVEKRIYLELIVSRERKDRCSGITWKLEKRETLTEGERTFEHQVWRVEFFPNEAWEALRAEWEGPDGWQSPNFDRDDHFRRRREAQQVAMFDYWFDVTGCYRSNMRGLDLPWELVGCGRGAITDFEAEVPGLGYSVAYHGLYVPSLEATAYLYSREGGTDSDGLEDKATLEHLQIAINDVLMTCAHAAIECSHVRTSISCLEDKTPAYLCAEFDLKSADGVQKTLLFLRGLGGKFLKIRVTVAADGQLANYPYAVANAFLKEVVGAGLSIRP